MKEKKLTLLMACARAIVTLLVLEVVTPLAFASPECQVRVLRPVTDDVGNVWQPGKILPVTILRKQESKTFYCAHGGSCLPRMVEGKQAVQLIDCSVGSTVGNDGDFLLVPKSKPALRK